MAHESPGWRELTKLMADHILSYINRDEFLAIVNSKGQADKVWQYRRPTRPSLNRFLVLPSLLGFLEQILVEKGPFLIERAKDDLQ